MKLRDIAKAAGVSLSTVSLVLNGKPGVGQEKRERVQQLLRENGYMTHSADEADTANRNIYFLKYSRHSYLVNGNPGFVTRIMDAAEQACRKHKYNLIVVSFSDFETIDLEGLFAKPSTMGAILLGTELSGEDMAPFLNLSKPLAIVDNALSRFSSSAVTMNNREAIFSVVDHLVDLGHRQIGFLFNSVPSSNDLERRHTFEEALHYHGCRFDPELVFPIFPTMDGARRSTEELLHAGTRFPRALVSSNDSIAMGAIRAFKEFGLSIPEDISVTGIDGLPFSAVADPPLTTVSVSCEEMGRWAVHILHEAIRGRCTMPCKIRVGTRLEIHGSTAAPNPARLHPSLLPEEL